MDRYQRHSLIDWFDQKKIKEAKLIVVGAGAVGNEVLKNLALLGAGSIVIVDFDRIEEHNLAKCVLFRDDDIGKYKAEVAAISCKNIDPNIEVIFRISDLWSGLTIGEISSADLVISCLDNYEARIQLNELCLIANTKFINTGIDSRYFSVELFPFLKSKETACYNCCLPMQAYKKLGERYKCGILKKIGYEEEKIPTTAITSSGAGAVAVSLAMNIINQHEHAPKGALKYFQDTITLNTTVSVPQMNEGCFMCNKYNDHIKVYKVGRFFSDIKETSNLLQIDMDSIFVLSDPILLTTKCNICGKNQEYYESATYITDAITFCMECNMYSIEIDYIERISLAEVERYYTDKKIPSKFLRHDMANKTIILEMED